MAPRPQRFKSSESQGVPRPTTTSSSGAPTATPARPPKNFGMILYRAFEPLDVYGPLSALGSLARSYQMNLALITETMEPVTLRPVSAAMNPLNSSFFSEFLPTHTYETAPKDLEVLIIPGGLYTRSPYLNSTIDYVKRTYPSLRYLITVCTGASVAARAGVLDGRRATTNKAAWADTIRHGPNVEWVPKARWVVDGNVWTSSGVSAGIDATLDFISQVYGAQIAKDIGIAMEYDWHTDPSWDPFADLYNLTSTA
ncbi:Isonitrile hydratase 5 [Colletotrichum chlorophyti]|uniref:Isonitrile hydratase 5 n=1 Tax=Colletotrichum chlorophyti TaxID=708187 RepID=A0A1Q8RKY6_9PEZI|nr:Isonitrile hydratase 5 [Colletotrichum chlorophyti]